MNSPASALICRRPLESTLSAITGDLGSITAGQININSGAFTVATNGDVYAAVLDAGVLQPTDITVQDDLVVVGSGSITFAPLGGSGTAYVCTDNAGLLYASAGGC